MVESSRTSADSQHYADYITVGLYKDGLSLEREDTDACFLTFDGIKVVDGCVGTQRLATIRALGVIGALDIGPGFLVVIHTQKPVFEREEVTIWNVTKALVIPLKYELARVYFKLEESDKSEGDSDVSSVKNSDSNSTSNATAQSNDNIGDKITDQLNRGKEMFFSKLGVYVNDLRSNPSLSFSTEEVSNKNDGLFDNQSASSSNSELKESDIKSFKLSRSITIRGLPPQQKDDPFSKIFDKSKDYYEANNHSHISTSMLRKIEKQLASFFSTGDFFYSNELNITKDIIYKDGQIQVKNCNEPNNSFCFNSHISCRFPRELVAPLIQGFVGSIDLIFPQVGTESKTGQLLLLSKRSTYRAGSRYLRRGIDDNGNVANFVSTSQILIVEELLDDKTPLFTKFDIIRGSIPIFFQQNPANLKPIPFLTRPLDRCEEPFQKHFNNLNTSYHKITCVSLVERSKKEVLIGDCYERLCEKYGVELSWFDFHEVCKKMKFENVVKLLDEALQNDDGSTVEGKLHEYGLFDSIAETSQTGIFRINCVDCLDRTNLVQKFLAEHVLKDYIFEKYGLSTDQQFQNLFNNLWADNGDFISRQYASTGALKGDFTRTSKRNYKGLLNDAFLTMSRYYNGYISDYSKQCFIDFLLGHANESIFEEFESTLNVLDPNEVVDDLNKKSDQLNRAMEQLEIPDDVIVLGSWSGFQSPLEYDTLKLRNDLRETSVFLTNRIIYLVQFDSTASKIIRSVMIPVEDVKGLEYGTYILSRHNSISTNPRRNIGLKFIVSVHTMPSLDATDNATKEKFVTIKFPQNMDYGKVKHIINLISKTCHSSTLENKDIITTKDASTDVIAMMEHKFKKLVWG